MLARHRGDRRSSRQVGIAMVTGHPAVIRYWEDGRRSEWLKPDESSGVTVETTAYVLLSLLLKVMSRPVL